MTRNTSSCTTPDGRNVTIQIDDVGEEIKVLDDEENEVGSIRLSYIDCENDDYYKITWMYLDKQGDKFLRQGIGREALKLHNEFFRSPIVASDDDGIVKGDGSHLTGDAPGFINVMRKEGLVCSSAFDETPEDDG